MNPYSLRKGKRVIEQQVDYINEGTKKALIDIIDKNFDYSTTLRNRISENLYSYHLFEFSVNISFYFYNGLKELESSDDVNDFLEIFASTMVGAYKEDRYYKGKVMYMLRKINEMLRFRQYMYYINLDTQEVIAYIDEYTKEEIENLLVFHNDVEDYIKRALKELRNVTGTAVHLACNGLEEFFKTEMKLKGKTLGGFIQSLKNDSKYISLNDLTKSVLAELLRVVKDTRNDAKSAGHPGNTIISYKEALYIIHSIVNIINLLR